MHDLMQWLPLVKQYGPWLVILAFFIWKDWKREIRHENRANALQDEIRGTLLTTLVNSSGVVTKNTEVLTRVEKRLDDWQFHIAPTR